MNVDDVRRLWRSGRDRASFSGLSNVARRTGMNRGLLRQQVFPYLTTYTKFRVAKRPRVYNPYFVRSYREVIQSDIIFMDRPVSMVRQNQGYKYILIVQDIFTRKVWARPLKDKSGRSVQNPLRDIFNDMAPFHGEARFVIDRGTEYLNAAVRALLEQFGLTITHPSDGHASHVERANLSLQRLLYQHMWEKGGPRTWVAYLPQAVALMNSRHHRIIRMSPNKAEDPANRVLLHEAMALYRDKAIHKELTSSGRKRKPTRFRVGDQVRIQRAKTVFNRGYQPTFTDEIFKVKQVLDHLPITMYKLTEWDEVTEIQGNFYPEELTLVRGDVFKIERILRRGLRGGVPSVYVKWEGFAPRYNSWIPERDLQQQ